MNKNVKIQKSKCIFNHIRNCTDKKIVKEYFSVKDRKLIVQYKCILIYRLGGVFLRSLIHRFLSENY